MSDADPQNTSSPSVDSHPETPSKLNGTNGEAKSVVFNNVEYLGSSTIKEPANEAALSAIIVQLNEGMKDGAMSVSVEVPFHYKLPIRLVEVFCGFQ